jgi:nitroimidazol reductase NimA-like FMN-containing flavoprotein (pyridoxamine 5'-phosphate oxidase superfamily)
MVFVSSPVTRLDQRYSDPEAVATDWEQARRILESAELFWICTVRGDGRPHVTPLVAVWADDALHFCTGADEQKAANIHAHPHVVLTTGCNTWQSGIDVVVEGDAVSVTDEQVLRGLAEAWSRKWDGQWEYVVRDGAFHQRVGEDGLSEPILVFSVTPTTVLAFAKGTFGHTKFSF